MYLTIALLSSGVRREFSCLRLIGDEERKRFSYDASHLEEQRRLLPCRVLLRITTIITEQSRLDVLSAQQQSHSLLSGQRDEKPLRISQCLRFVFVRYQSFPFSLFKVQGHGLIILALEKDPYVGTNCKLTGRSAPSTALVQLASAPPDAANDA